MTSIGNTQYSLIPPAILQQLQDANIKGEPLKCTGNVDNEAPMIKHSFDYNEILKFYNWR